jgi:hypothetical protein
LNQLEERGASYSNSASGLGLNVNDENYAAGASLQIYKNKENRVNKYQFRSGDGGGAQTLEVW